MNDLEGIFLFRSDFNLVIGNRTNDNTTGIYLTSSADDNVVKMNKARDNGIVDLDDDNADNGPGLCGTNTWSMNVFTTSGNACID